MHKSKIMLNLGDSCMNVGGYAHIFPMAKEKLC